MLRASSPKQTKCTPLRRMVVSKNKHKHVPYGFWKQQANQRLFMDDLGKKIGITTLDDWYNNMSQKIIIENGGSGLLMTFHGSPSELLLSVYPEHNWIPWKFKTLRHGFWSTRANQRKYFDWLGKELGVEELDDWYEKLSQRTLLQYGGSALLLLYKNSPTTALISSYPEHNWILWKFNMVPVKYWNAKENVQRFLSELSEKLSITTLDDWYLVDKTQLQRHGGGSLRTKYKSLYEILNTLYPHHNWDPKRFQRSGKKAQRLLAVTLKKIFPNEEIVEDYMHPKVLLPSSNRPMQLDVFIPSKSLAFEYQGKQHYQDVGIFGSSKLHQQRDAEKRFLCASNNIKLVEVPYWWNNSKTFLQHAIQTVS